MPPTTCLKKGTNDKLNAISKSKRDRSNLTKGMKLKVQCKIGRPDQSKFSIKRSAISAQKLDPAATASMKLRSREEEVIDPLLMYK